MIEKKFNPQKLERLNDPQRLIYLPPDHIWGKIAGENTDVLIDIGAGTGVFSKAFSDLSGGKAKIFACDIADILLEWMEKNVCNDYPNIRTVKMPESSVPLDDNFADIVYMINLHHELDDPDEILKQCYRILKVNGCVMVVDWRKEETDGGPPVEIRFYADTVREQMTAAGFSDIRIFNDLPKHFIVIGRK